MRNKSFLTTAVCGKILFTAIVAITAAIFFEPEAISAHGDGQEFTETVGSYIVDISYDAAPLTVHEPVLFDFRILDAATQEPVEFTDVWVRVNNASKTLFAGPISKARIGPTAVLLAFPEGGEQEMLVRYQNGDEKLAETTFNIVVEAPSLVNQPTYNWLISLGVGLVLGFLLSMVLLKKSRS